ncbi:hypothetical protein [Fibrobacter sp. UWEL]|uniref:hypothetical protein n=1 Tax=Fibrobacter sp. UWEL TaxID=1896209 RepID=UPI00091C83D5|nr:hypothetical protein [Fibrobacter sp. UWEL]SHL31239.1 hypothetical protein SAMN05720468_12156 [Fibrobacter sp. UWEL]
MEKKEYTAPTMTIVQLTAMSCLLQGSGDGPEVDEYEGEFGINFEANNKKNA